MRTSLHTSAPLLLLAALSSLAGAAEWKIDPRLALVGGYNDNVRLTTMDEIESWVATLQPSVVFSVNTPRSGASGGVVFDFASYEAESDLNQNNVRFTAGAFHSTERSRIGLDLSLIDDTTLDSQLEETGLVFARVGRTRYDITPNWTWSLSERSNVRLNYTYTDTNYEDEPGTGFVDYRLHAGSMIMNRAMSPKSQASLSLSYTASENDIDTKSSNAGVQGGASYQFSETLSTSLFVGVRYTEVDYKAFQQTNIFFPPTLQDVSKSGWGSTFDVSISKRFERGETTLSAYRGITNQINGQPLETTRLQWRNLYRFAETVTGEVNLEAYNTRSETLVGQQLDRDYYSIQTQLKWDFAQFWSLAARYRYRIQLYDESNDDAKQNAAYLTLTYLWPRIAGSR